VIRLMPDLPLMFWGKRGTPLASRGGRVAAQPQTCRQTLTQARLLPRKTGGRPPTRSSQPANHDSPHAGRQPTRPSHQDHLSHTPLRGREHKRSYRSMDRISAEPVSLGQLQLVPAAATPPPQRIRVLFLETGGDLLPNQTGREVG